MSNTSRIRGRADYKVVDNRAILLQHSIVPIPVVPRLDGRNDYLSC